MIRAVLFDIDGTLIDSNELHVDAWVQAFGEHGHAPGAPAIRQQIGKGADNLVPTLIPGAGDAEVEALSAAHGRLFKQLFLPRARAFPHARDLLARAHGAGLRVVLASSASREEADHYLDLLDARSLVHAATSIDDVETSKPAPDIFAVALRKAGVSPEEAVAVGDAPWDAEAAGRAGIALVAVLSGGFEEAELRRAGAAAVYRDAADLLTRYAESLLSA
jgi:membrane protein